MNKKLFIFFSFLIISGATTLSLVLPKTNQEAIQISQQGEIKNMSKRDQVLRARQRYQERYQHYQTVKQNHNFSQSYQEQQTTVDVPSSDLDMPYLLSVSLPQNETQLTAEVFINGQSIRKIRGSHNTIDLSSYLTFGQQIIEISGIYSPDQATVKIELIGKATQISQETGGNGKIRQKLVLNVE